MDKYVTFGQIEEVAQSHFQKYGTKTGFKNIVRSLFEAHMEHDTPPALPDAISWGEMDDATFFQLLKGLPVSHTFDDFNRFSKDKLDIAVSATSMIPEILEVFSIVYIPNIRENRHTHDFFEMNYVMRGQCKMSFENNTKMLYTGDFCIIAPGSRHDVTFGDDSVVVAIMLRKDIFETTFFKLLAQEDLLASFFRGTLYAGTENANYMLFQTGPSTDVKNAIKNIFMECYVNDLYSNACIASRIQLLFALLIRRFGKQISFYDTKRNADDRADFAQILWYIQKNYTTVTLQSLAETFHYNPSYLSSLIKKNTGRTLFDILSDLKMNEAAELLRHTNMKISQISDILGYDSVDYFSRLFKKTYGVPPKQYALQNH